MVKFGAFILLDAGVEGLAHASELADPPPSDPQDVVRRGDELVLRVLRIDSLRHRISLSLKRVSPQERGEWLARQEHSGMAETGEVNATPPGRQEAPSDLEHATEEVTPAASEQPAEESLPEPPTPAIVIPPEDEEFWGSLLKEEEAETV